MRVMGFAETFKALSDPIRREILMMLRDGSMSAGEIGVHFDMTGATISYHLKILRKHHIQTLTCHFTCHFNFYCLVHVFLSC